MPDGSVGLSKAHAYTLHRKQPIRFLSSTTSYLGPKIRWSRRQKKTPYWIGAFVVSGQIQPHKIGLSDLRSPDSQIQFRHTPNTIPIKDGPSHGFHSTRVFSSLRESETEKVHDDRGNTLLLYQLERASSWCLQLTNGIADDARIPSTVAREWYLRGIELCSL